MIGAFLNLSRPLAMQALSNPRILGSLLVGAVGSQQANEIQNQLSLGNISLDDVYDTIINFAASPVIGAINEMQTTPAGKVFAPKESEIEAERKFNEELNRRVTLPSEISIDQILSTPPTTTVPEPLITPDVPEEKTKVEDVGFTESKQKPSDFIMTSEDTKYIKDKDKLDQIFEGQDNLFKEGDYGDPKVYFENINVGYGSVPFYEPWEDAYQGGVADLGDPKAASKITNYPDYKEYQTMIQDYFRENVGEEFVTYRLTTEEDAKKFLDKDVKSYKAKSFTMSPSQAISFAYFANEKFMDMDTYQPKDNLVLLEVPIKPEHLVMRGKSGEKEVVAKTNKIDKSDIRVYNPYTGEVVQDATTGFLKDSPLLDLGSESVPTIKIKQEEETETIQPGQYTVKDKEAWLKKREEEFEKEQSNISIEEVPKDLKDRSKFYYEQIGLKQRQEPEDAMLEATRFHSGVLAKSLEDIGDLSHRITEGSPGAVLEKVNRQIKMLEDQDYRMPFLENHKYDIRGNVVSLNRDAKDNKTGQEITTEEYEKKLNSLLEKYVSAHEKLPVFNPIHQAAKDAAISIGKLDVDGALKNLYFLRDKLKKGEKSFQEEALSFSELEDKNKVVKLKPKELPPRDESSGMAADYVAPEYGPQAFDLTQEIDEEFSPEGFSTFSTDVGDNYQYLRTFIFDQDPKVKEELMNFIITLKRIKGNPDAIITMYRAAPTSELREGDLLTPSKSQAQFYVDQSKITKEEVRDAERKARLDTDEPIDLAKEKMFRVMDNLIDIMGVPEATPSELFEYKIKAKDLRWDGGNRGISGWGYFPTK